MTLGCHLRGFYFSVQPQCGGPYLISRRPDHKESRRTKERVPFVPCVTVELGRVIFCCPWTETYAIRAPGSPGSYLRGNPPATSLGLRPADGGPWARPPGLRDCRSRSIITLHADERETQPWRIRLPRPLTLLLWRSLTTTAALTASGASVAFARTRQAFRALLSAPTDARRRPVSFRTNASPIAPGPCLRHVCPCVTSRVSNVRPHACHLLPLQTSTKTEGQGRTTCPGSEAPFPAA